MPFWPPALAQQAPPAIILAALRRFRGAALFHGPRPSSGLGAPFWPSGLTVRRSRPPTAAAELRALVCENVITESFVLLVQELVSSIAFKIAVRLKVGQHEQWKRMALEFFVFALLVIPLFFIFGWLFLQAVSWLL